MGNAECSEIRNELKSITDAALASLKENIKPDADGKFDWGSDMANMCRDRFYYYKTRQGKIEADNAVSYDRECVDWNEVKVRLIEMTGIDEISLCAIDNPEDFLIDSIINLCEITAIKELVEAKYVGLEINSPYTDAGMRFADEIGICCWLLYLKDIWDERSFIGFGA